jgi:prepilin-type N-terminal cleavage/methylation domain-containing protein
MKTPLSSRFARDFLFRVARATCCPGALETISSAQEAKNEFRSSLDTPPLPAAFSDPGNVVVRANRHQAGFTLLEMMITLTVFLILAAAVFGLLTGTLQSAATLQDNQGRSDQLSSLYAFIKTKLTQMPARSTISSYLRGDGDGLVQNGIIFGNTNLATAIDAKIQPNGYYILRLTSFASSASADQSQDARQSLATSVTTDDPTLSWTLLISDVKTLDWKFQDVNLAQWLDTWSSNTTPNLVEFTLQGAGDLQPTTMDFWVPKINPISVRIQANSTSGTTGGGGTSTNRPPGTPEPPPRQPLGNRTP